MKKLCLPLVLFLAGASASWAANLEEDFWAIASQSGSSETLNTFLAVFPDSGYAQEARSLVSGLADTSVAANSRIRFLPWSAKSLTTSL